MAAGSTLASKPLAELNAKEWEALCDGCGKCCLHKLEDDATGELYYTRVHCRLLDASACRCSDYANRARLVPDCVNLRTQVQGQLEWLPATCAYRLRAQGQPLPAWHHLLSGSRETVHTAGMSARGKVLSEVLVHPDGYDEHIVHWVE